MTRINLKIQKPAYGGYGLGFYEGKACFVPYAVPGDDVAVEIYQEKKDYCFGRIIKFNKQAETRIKPECPNFGTCGGCDYLNISYNDELRQKKEILEESLSRIASLDISSINISIENDKRFNYRSHASVKANAEGNYGFYTKDSNILVPFPEDGCRLLAEPLVRGLSEQQRLNKKEFKIACSYKGGCFLSTDKQNIIQEIEHGILYERSIRLFFQANGFLRSRMLEIVRGYADIGASDSFLDIGCGVGFFALYLAANANAGYGIDIDRESIKWARRNALLNKRDNVKFAAESASEACSYKHSFRAAIADPPRAGLSAKARAALKAIAPQRIVYVSCNPSTFARDTRDIISYGYSLQKITLIDMFPGTHHIELIALFA